MSADTVMDDYLVAASGDLARDAEAGIEPKQSVVSLLRAIASTREEHRRHALADAALIRAGDIGPIARDIIRIAIFALL